MKRAAVLFFLLTSLVSQGLYAQVQGGVRLADLEQDILSLRSQVGELRLMIEALQRENAQLRQAVSGQERSAASQSYVTVQQLNASLQALRSDLQAADSRTREEVVAEVSRQIDRLAKQTQQAMQALAGAVQNAPQAPTTIQFSDDFPKDGVAYTVVSGDTLSGIAKKFNSTSRDIQNANRITDPTRIQVGQTLFIPQRK